MAAVMVALGLGVGLAGPAEAQEPARGAIEIDWGVHVPIVVAGGLGLGLSEALFKDRLADDRCSWCEGNAFDDHARAELRWSDTESAHQLSNALVYGIAPASAFGLTALVGWRDGRAADWPVNAFAVLEATILAADLTQLAKFYSGRARPYLRELGEDLAGAPGPAAEHNLSFFSGHTSFAFSLAVASGTVASMRGYRGAPAVWGVGLGAAALTGWLRVAADRHYASDVLTGALVGSAVGFAVPYLLHRRRRPDSVKDVRVGVAPVAGGGLVVLGWQR
jgi:membrane-associated phospholipid phosphatase